MAWTQAGQVEARGGGQDVQTRRDQARKGGGRHLYRSGGDSQDTRCQDEPGQAQGGNEYFSQ